MRTNKKAALALLASILVTSHAMAADDLADGFRSPPASAEPRTWWHWVSGHVSKEGITADLEAIKHVGVGGVQAFSVDQGPRADKPVLADPRSAARFLCGLTSPRLSKAKLGGHPLFGRLADAPFPKVLARLEGKG